MQQLAYSSNQYNNIWTTRDNKYDDNPTSVYEMIGFIYGGGADNVSVEVTASFHIEAPGWSFAYDPVNATLDNPY